MNNIFKNLWPQNIKNGPKKECTTEACPIIAPKLQKNSGGKILNSVGGIWGARRIQWEGI